MKKLSVLICLLVVTLTAQAQFEKGKWVVSPSLTGLNFSHNTEYSENSFGFEAKGGAFLMDNVALLLNAGASWSNKRADIYTVGVGGRYYFDKIGIYTGANVNLNHRKNEGSSTRCSFGLEAGYAFFLSRTATVEPAAYWDIDGEGSRFGLRVGFGFYF